MQPLHRANDGAFAAVRFVLTDMDETLTRHGRLAAATYDALERLQRIGVRVIPVTAAPAGWCDQMARMWPIDGVIAENGGVFFQRTACGHDLHRLYWHSEEIRRDVRLRFDQIVQKLRRAHPSARLADDQPFRLTSIAFARPPDAGERQALVSILRDCGLETTVNNLWVLGWIGDYDKLSMTRKVMKEIFEFDIDTDCGLDGLLYSGDSTNDAPMFAHFRHTVGVCTVREHLNDIPVPPKWITEGPGGEGFVEIANAVIEDLFECDRR